MTIPPFNKTRKLIHLTVGLLIYLLTFFLEKDILLWLIVAGSIFAFATFPFPRFHSLHHSQEGSLGTLFYPAGILSAYLVLYPADILFFRVTLLVLVVSDSLANLAGQINYHNDRFRLLNPKSLYGLLAYAISALIIFLVFLPSEFTGSFFLLLFLVLLTVASEAVSYRGSDNLSIPLVLALFFRYHQAIGPDLILQVIVLTVFSAGAILLFRFHILSRRASVGAWLLGLHLTLVMGWQWLLPVLLFFVTSVILTKVHAAVAHRASSGGRRNLWQVTANSLWALASTIGYLLSGHDLFITLFIVFMAAVTADTWASEAGPLFNHKAFSLKELRMRKAGITGGISIGGTLAALAGAALVAALSHYWFFGHYDLRRISLITLAALVGTFADSLLGAFVENKLHTIKPFASQHHGEAITPNDLVNLGGSLVAGMVLLMLL